MDGRDFHKQGITFSPSLTSLTSIQDSDFEKRKAPPETASGESQKDDIAAGNHQKS